MGERGNFRPRRLDGGGIDARRDNADFGARVGKNFTPGIDNQGVSIGLPPAFVFAALPAGMDITTILDRAGAQEAVPMSLARRTGKGRGQGQKLRAALSQGPE